MNKKDNIILIGFMGCGKSSVGIRLSYALKRTIIDTDKLIEKQQETTIARIFETKGEAAFREMETHCIKQLLEDTDRQIISTGGGLPMKEENHKLLKELGRVYYLRITKEAVYERLKGDTTRPLLQGDNPQEKIEALLVKRAPLYEACADYIIDVSEKSFDEIIEEIKEKESMQYENSDY